MSSCPCVSRKLSSLFELGSNPHLFTRLLNSCLQSSLLGYLRYGIPYDVAWLDIEHTDAKRYLTWDLEHFPDPIAMQQRLADVGRKMVVIVDPHIFVDPEYKVYANALEGSDTCEGPGTYFVLNSEGEVFVGSCWPGRWVASGRKAHRVCNA